MANLARRNFRKDTQKLADILRLLPAPRLEQLGDFVNHHRNNERDFHAGGFTAGIRFDILENGSAEKFSDFENILEMYESRTSTLRLLSLLSDALRLAARGQASPPAKAPAMIPDLNDPMTKRILSGM